MQVSDCHVRFFPPRDTQGDGGGGSGADVGPTSRADVTTGIARQWHQWAVLVGSLTQAELMSSYEYIGGCQCLVLSVLLICIA